MTTVKIGQKLWDEKNCMEVEIMSFNGSVYFCRTTAGGSDAEDYQWYTPDYQWFTPSELNGFKPMR